MTMKLRNRLIALVCLLLFLGFGAGLFLSTTGRKPFAVILFVADNLTPSTLTAARIFYGGGDARLQLEDFPNSALCRNAANDFSVPDAASASTAIASGKRVNRGSLCIDPSGSRLSSLLEDAALRGRSTGLITTGNIGGVTAAAYYAKSADAASNTALLTKDFMAHQPFDFVAGGGARSFDALTSPEKPTSRDPLATLKEKGVVVARSIQELENQPFWKKSPQLALLASDELSPKQGDDGTPSLSSLVRMAIRKLQGNPRGYLLVVDDPMIGRAAASNDAESLFERFLAFDEAISTAQKYAGDRALIVVTGRENVAGLQLNGYPFLKDKGVATLALNTQGVPSLCWANGPGYSMEGGDAKHGKKGTSGILSQPSACPLPSGTGVAGDVIAFGSGEGSEKIHGFMDLTDLHRLLSEFL